ncbi:long-subunit acyl-CoA synthetase (AMP-forming) [Amycolatopsis jiangsuensis]|uniref:Long-subunit acyl-CoA synthetase (AMP-forming) n=1 Tax=Amycolatopsis jiangsuensis TaxID=1181879 RepID=A0A840J8D2_9PSEU|nr:long-subunit acyl-CoA synthetase (AMP-forming) [Amycolatopsis jiangsuensis]
MPVTVLHDSEKQFDCAVHEGYGLSEMLPVASPNQPGHECKPDTIGSRASCEMRA